MIAKASPNNTHFADSIHNCTFQRWKKSYREVQIGYGGPKLSSKIPAKNKDFFILFLDLENARSS
jgi:hypothetical protein